MYIYLLAFHILVATLMTGATLGVIGAAYARRITRAYSVMLASFGVTIVSGIGLLFVSTAGLGGFCAMMTIFALSTFVARAYYRKRTIAISSL